MLLLLLLFLPGLLSDTPPDPHVSDTKLYEKNGNKYLLVKKRRESENVVQGSSPAVLYLPLGGGVSPGCQSAAGAKLTQA